MYLRVAQILELADAFAMLVVETLPKQQPDMSWYGGQGWCGWGVGKGSSGYGDGEFDHEYDFGSLSPLHYSTLASDPHTLSEFDRHGENFHPDVYPDFSAPNSEGAQSINGPAGAGSG